MHKMIVLFAMLFVLTVSIAASQQPATVLRVLDGDTIDVETEGVKERVRYIGVAAPELHTIAPCAERWGAAAKAMNVSLVSGRVVILQLDQQTRDKYGRLLAYVWTTEGLVNQILIETGLAKAVRGTNKKYWDRLRQAEVEAKQAGRGFWEP